MYSRISSFLKEDLFSLKIQNQIFSKGKVKYIFLVAGIVFIFLWQKNFWDYKQDLSSQYSRNCVTGFNHYWGQKFFYFYYYLDYFPLTTSIEKLEYSRLGAENQLKEHGDSLLMEWNHWSRYGEPNRINMYLPNAWKTGSAENPSIKLTNLIVLFSSLIFLFFAFFIIGYPLLGAMIILILGSNPFILYEHYNNENILGLIVSITILILAFNYLFFSNEKKKLFHYLIPPLISGIIIGFFSTVRSEIISVVACTILIYCFASKVNWKIKLGLITILILSFFLTQILITKHFENKFQETKLMVKKHDGVPFDGMRVNTHPFWHPVFVGLGDFDTKYGFKLHDTVAYKYALPILKEKYHLSFHMKGKYTLQEYYDDKNKYYKKLEEYPQYEAVMKDKVISTIKSDPLWYLNILAKRINLVFADTSPIQIKIGHHAFSLSILNLFFIPVLLLLIWLRQWFYVRLLVFSLPLAASSIIMFATENSTFNSIFHLIFAGIVLSWLIELVLFLLDKKFKFYQKKMY